MVDGKQVIYPSGKVPQSFWQVGRGLTVEQAAGCVHIFTRKFDSLVSILLGSNMTTPLSCLQVYNSVRVSGTNNR